MRIAVILALTIGSCFGAPGPAEFKRQAGRCERILRTSLIEFYLPACLDREHGGYLESLRGGAFAGTGEKFLTLQARQLWFFSTLALEGCEREAALAAAKHGYEFLQTKMRDPEHGGYYSKVTDDGAPKDTRKHAYLNAFALYGLTAYANAARDAEALKAAQALFETLEARAHDGEFGGYIEFFERDWRPVTDPRAQGYVGATGHKTYNTHLHLLESYTELFRAWPDERLRRRIAELQMINVSTVHDAGENHNVDAYHRDWTVVREPRNLRASYGHDVECIWLVMDSARAVGMAPALLRTWAAGLAEASLKFGYDFTHGGFYQGGELGRPADDLRKTWWVQTEALLGMLEMYRLTGEVKYYEAFAQTLDFCEKYQVAKEGGWWATRAANGSPTADQQRSGPWQGAYHAGRAMINAAKWLKEMARQP